MKFALLTVSLFVVNGAFASNEKLVPSPVEKLFVPMGFDDNDNTEIVVHGHFMNSCYKTGPSEFSVDESKKLIRVMPQSYEYSNAICAQVVIPFIQTVKLGMLTAGTYTVEIGNSNGVESRSLVVKPRVTESPDDFVYAPVDRANVEFGANPSEQSVVISGRYPPTYVGCAIVNEVRVSQTPGDVLLVLPIMELLSDRLECIARNWSPTFEFKQKLSIPMKSGDHLLHVRVLNGNSLNKIETVPENR